MNHNLVNECASLIERVERNSCSSSDDLMYARHFDPSIVSISVIQGGNVSKKQIDTFGYEDQLYVITDELRGKQYQLSVCGSRYEITVPIKNGRVVISTKLESDPVEVVEQIEQQFTNKQTETNET